jgi:Flp pilus assembly protein CpaB
MSNRMPFIPRLERTGRPARSLRRRGLVPATDVKRVLVILSAVLAGLLNYLLLTGGGGQTLVGIARVALDPGTVIVPEEHLEFRPITGDVDLLARLTTAPDQVRGAVVLRPVEAGSPILPGSLLAPGHDAALRVISIPVDRHLAAGGDLRRGDIVDVIAVDEGDPRILAEDITVLATAAVSSGFGQYHVVVTVPRTDVPELAAAIERSTVMLARSGRGL